MQLVTGLIESCQSCVSVIIIPLMACLKLSKPVQTCPCSCLFNELLWQLPQGHNQELCWDYRSFWLRSQEEELTLCGRHVMLPPTALTAHVMLPPTALTAHVMLPPTALTDHVMLPPTALTAHVMLPPTALTAHVMLPPTALTAHVMLPPTALTDHAMLPPTALTAMSCYLLLP